jgi:hypothetical protein
MKSPQKKIRADLERIREWADEKIGAGNEPPWAWYQYMKLRETLDAILAGMSAVRLPLADSLESGPRPETALRLAVCNDRQDTALHRRPKPPTPLPM